MATFSERFGFDVLPQSICSHPMDQREDFGLGVTCKLCYKVLVPPDETVTAAMAEAGVRELEQFHSDKNMGDEAPTVTRIYRAMRAAAR